MGTKGETVEKPRYTRQSLALTPPRCFLLRSCTLVRETLVDVTGGKRGQEDLLIEHC